MRSAIALLLLLIAAATAPQLAAAADPVAITEAPALQWGFKNSWRTYANQPQVAPGSGVAVVPDSSAVGWTLAWDFTSGEYDATARTTVLRYHGSVEWFGHPALLEHATPPAGYTGPTDIYLLDLTLTDPTVTISRDKATISAQVTSRSLSTWQVVDYGRIDVVDLAADAVTPTVAGGTTTWTGLPAAIDAQASAPFGDTYYRPGIPVDPVSLSYTGPGGAPDFSDQFDPQGQVKLGLDGDNVLLAPVDTGVTAYETVAYDPQRRLAYTRLRSADSWTFQTYDVSAMRAVGPTLVVPANGALGTFSFLDTATGRVYFTDGSWLRYDADTTSFERGQSETAPRMSTAVGWDPIGKRAFQVVRTVPAGVGASDYDHHQWQLKTYAEQSDGTWQTKAYDLPNGPAHLNQSVYAISGVTASDGSLILLGVLQSSDDASVPAPATIPGAYRIVLGADGTADARPIAGTDVANTNAGRFTFAVTGAGGQVALVKTSGRGTLQRVDVTPAAGPITAEAPVDLGFTVTTEIKAPTARPGSPASRPSASSRSATGASWPTRRSPTATRAWARSSPWPTIAW
jgi:hypothetical protein